MAPLSIFLSLLAFGISITALIIALRAPAQMVEAYQEKQRQDLKRQALAQHQRVPDQDGEVVAGKSGQNLSARTAHDMAARPHAGA